jgi:PAT family beta-lactamase induction signal transducer AmpG
MLFLGFSAGLPIMLIFSSLSLWLREAGVDRSVVTFFSWAALGYSFKFVWAPLVDSLPLPLLTRYFGRRRAWILLAQVMISASIILMSSFDPAVAEANLAYLAVAAVLLGFSSATQDIVIDAYRIESAGPELQALMSSTYIAGYRVGMLVAGAGALYIASGLGTTMEVYSYTAWRITYLIMAGFMLVGMVTTFVIPEPGNFSGQSAGLRSDHLKVVILFLCCVSAFILVYFHTSGVAGYLRNSAGALLDNRVLVSALVEFLRLLCAIGSAFAMAMLLIKIKIIPWTVVKRLYVNPVADFFVRYGTSFAILLLLLVGFYRTSDIVLGVISNVFYQDLGYTKNEIATVSKLFGLWMTLVGGFVGGLLAVRFGVVRILLLGAILAAATNLLFVFLANTGYNIPLLYAVIGADNLSGGLASAAFVAFLSALTNVKFSAMQFAIFTSLMSLFPKVLGGYSGSIVDSTGYPQFFLFTAALGVPVIIVIIVVSRKIEI